MLHGNHLNTFHFQCSWLLIFCSHLADAQSCITICTENDCKADILVLTPTIYLGFNPDHMQIGNIGDTEACG